MQPEITAWVAGSPAWEVENRGRNGTAPDWNGTAPDWNGMTADWNGAEPGWSDGEQGFDGLPDHNDQPDWGSAPARTDLADPDRAATSDRNPDRDQISPRNRTSAKNRIFARSRISARKSDNTTWSIAPSRPGDEAWAMLTYLCAAILGFLPPLAIYLINIRRSPFVRAHAAQAVNFAVTMMLYTISAVIVGGMLALDSVSFALMTVGGAAILLWLVALVHLTRAGLAASGGIFYQIPGWLCATVLRR